MRRRSWFILASAVFTVGAFFLWPRGVKTVVGNVGFSTLRDVRVVVTGATYKLGDVRPKESRSVHVNPSGESHIILQYTDTVGASQSISVDCYMEPGYSGSIALDVANGVVVRARDRIRITPW